MQDRKKWIIRLLILLNIVLAAYLFLTISEQKQKKKEKALEKTIQIELLEEQVKGSGNPD